MMHYKIWRADTHNHFIGLELSLTNLNQNLIELQLPAWRPGRYELQNFAKNIRCFEVKDENGNNVAYKKTSKDCWQIDTTYKSSITVTYQYYANQPDAGACYVDDTMLYINPVHCFMYVVGQLNNPYTLTLDLPSNYQIACQMHQPAALQLHAPNFDYLADSPFIASANLKHHSFKVNQTRFHFWIEGQHPFKVERLTEDTTAYIKTQTEVFGELPCANYHFLYLFHPYPARHGVEHLDSTVIAMGQLPDSTEEEYYHDLLAISSHELFHLWNIKRIRPQEMLPYNFTQENYSTLGYIYEGVTTYYGDLMLLQSGVWQWEQYANSFNGDLNKHLTNEGRFNYSVAESSWDTWLDGYVPGVKGRKVSIYIEGMIAALIADITIIENSIGKHSLHDVMRDLYVECYKTNTGYTETTYKQLLEKYAGTSFDTYFAENIWGKGKLYTNLQSALQLAGCQINEGNNNTCKITRMHAPTQRQEMVFSKWTESKKP